MPEISPVPMLLKGEAITWGNNQMKHRAKYVTPAYCHQMVLMLLGGTMCLIFLEKLKATLITVSIKRQSKAGAERQLFFF